MTDILQGAWSGLQQTSALELTAVLLALSYLLLVVREHIACWLAAAVSTSIYLYLFFDVGLYAESLLQVYYLGMAGYGYYQWRLGANRQNLKPVIVTCTLALAELLKVVESQAPYLDAFTTCASIVTTYMVAQKVLENWLYWFVIDSASIVLYLERGLYFTALLFLIYLLIIAVGYSRWRQQYHRQSCEGA
jgi:nicotinamide mononucleotide transporter